VCIYYLLPSVFLYFVLQTPIHMKAKITLLLAVVLTLNAIGSPYPQPQPSKFFSVNNFGNVNVHRQHNNAALSWTFNSTDVSGFVIKRSYDGTWFSTVGTQAAGSGHWTKYCDSTVEPGTVFYKIVAVMKDGSQEESPVAEVRIVRHR
jgi:hypothetical protein